MEFCHHLFTTCACLSKPMWLSFSCVTQKVNFEQHPVHSFQWPLKLHEDWGSKMARKQHESIIHVLSTEAMIIKVHERSSDLWMNRSFHLISSSSLTKPLWWNRFESWTQWLWMQQFTAHWREDYQRITT